MVKYTVVFITLLLAIGINLQDNMIARTGFDSGVLTAALVAIALTALLAYRSVTLIVVIMLLVIGANLPADVAAGIHLDRDVLLATLIALLLMPFLQRHLDN